MKYGVSVLNKRIYKDKSLNEIDFHYHYTDQD